LERLVYSRERLVYSCGFGQLSLLSVDKNSLTQAASVRTSMSAAVDANLTGAATAAAEHLPAPYAAIEAREPRRSRRTLILRSLVVADSIGLSAAFLASVLLFGLSAEGSDTRPMYEFVVFFLSLPAWMLLAAMHDLYRYDDKRVGYSTVDDFVGVIHLVTLGAWIFFLGCWITGISYPRPGKLIVFWVLATLLVSGFRALARSICLRSPAYIQKTVIVGAGEIGQLVARKVSQHREYGLRLLGLVDDEPRQLRADLGDLGMLGTLDELRGLVRECEVDRVIVAFSSEPDARTAEVLRSLRDLDVHIDVVPRLYELLGPRVDLHTLEGLPLVGLQSTCHSAVALKVKRLIDIVGASLGLALLSPLFLLIAWRIRRDSPGPVFFRQTRLGLNMREFTALKFRTMWADVDDSAHRAYISETMSASTTLGANGRYKLDRTGDITPTGHWLRKSSLDELPQLINVLRGEMSLVGPRPCIPYEVQNFKPHHFERFLLPQGLTGLWQVTARASASFGEALDMDVAYVRDWSLGLDLRLMFRTPLQLLREGGTA
jgi:exopolysaccharide biosynthesis polyprenyl glycosylphosphotransferase